MGGAANPVGPWFRSLSSSGCTGCPDAVTCDAEPLGRPAGIEKPTTDEVGRRDFDEDAAASPVWSNDAQDFFGGGTAGAAGAGAGIEVCSVSATTAALVSEETDRSGGWADVCGTTAVETMGDAIVFVWVDGDELAAADTEVCEDNGEPGTGVSWRVELAGVVSAVEEEAT